MVNEHEIDTIIFFESSGLNVFSWMYDALVFHGGFPLNGKFLFNKDPERSKLVDQLW